MKLKRDVKTRQAPKNQTVLNINQQLLTHTSVVKVKDCGERGSLSL